MKSAAVAPQINSKKKVYRKDARNKSNKPRRPLSAYNIFFREERELIVRERNQSASSGGLEGHSKGKEFFASMGKTIAKRWCNLAPSRIQHFKQLAAKDMERYRKEKIAHIGDEQKEGKRAGHKSDEKISQDTRVIQSRRAVPDENLSVLSDVRDTQDDFASREVTSPSPSRATNAGLNVKLPLTSPTAAIHLNDASKGSPRNGINGRLDGNSYSSSCVVSSVHKRAEFTNSNGRTMFANTSASRGDGEVCTEVVKKDRKPTSDEEEMFLNMKSPYRDATVSTVSHHSLARLIVRDKPLRNDIKDGRQVFSEAQESSIHSMLFGVEQGLVGDHRGGTGVLPGCNHLAESSHKFRHISHQRANLLGVTAADLQAAILKAKGDAMLPYYQHSSHDEHILARNDFSRVENAVQPQHYATALDSNVAHDELYRCVAPPSLRNSQQMGYLVPDMTIQSTLDHVVRNHNGSSIQFLHHLAQLQREQIESNALLKLSLLIDRPRANLRPLPPTSTFYVQQERQTLFSDPFFTRQQMPEASYLNDFFVRSLLPRK